MARGRWYTYNWTTLERGHGEQSRFAMWVKGENGHSDIIEAIEILTHDESSFTVRTCPKYGASRVLVVPASQRVLAAGIGFKAAARNADALARWEQEHPETVDYVSPVRTKEERLELWRKAKAKQEARSDGTT